MTPAELEALVEGYFRDWTVLRSGSRAERLALERDANRPWDTLAQLLTGPSEVDQAWPLILALIEQAPSDEALAYVAAGPLEDLIHAHGAEFGDRIVDQARRDPRLRQALGGVWGWERVPEPLRGRLLELAHPLT
jgi:hypothetical protein